MKKIVISCFILGLVFLWGFININAQEFTVSIEEGAQIRLNDPTGLRFCGKVSSPVTGDYVRYGIVFAKGRVNPEEIYVGRNGCFEGEVEEIYADNTFYISMVNFPEYAYGQDITARAYVRVGEENPQYTYSATGTTRNLYSVAKAWSKMHPDEEYIQKVINKKYAITYNFNGGSTAYESRDDMIEDFILDYNTFAKTSINSIELYGAHVCDHISTATDFFKNEEMRTKWMWLIEEIKKAAVNNLSIINGCNDIIASPENKVSPYVVQNIPLYMLRISSLTWESDYVNYGTLPSTSSCFDFTKTDVDNFRIAMVGETMDVNLGPADSTVQTVYKTGYTFNGWFIDSEFYSSIITNMTCDEKFANEFDLFAKFTKNTYNITYLDAKTSIDKKYLTYDVESEFDLPVLEKTDGYDFMGWFDQNDKMVTKIRKGTIGDLELTAKWRPSLCVTLEFNGGNLRYQNIYELVDDLLADLTAYYGKTITAENVASATENSKPMYEFFTESVYKAKWGFMYDYFINTRQNDLERSNETTFLKTFNNAYWRYEVEAFVNCTQVAKWPYSSNYTDEIRENVWDYLNSESTTNYFITEFTLPTVVYKQGYRFIGWFDEDGNSITKPNKSMTVYARFELRN